MTMKVIQLLVTKKTIITYYNYTKNGVDVVNTMYAEYTIAKGTKHWPLCLIFALMNLSVLNVYVILKMNQVA